MWRTKIFKTKAAYDAWVRRNGLRYEWHDIFINNGYGVEYRPHKFTWKQLRRIY